MTWLALGLVLFFATHSLRMLAPHWREQMISRLGLPAWKGWYSLVSLAGLSLVAWGFDAAREQPVVLWMPALALRHAAGLLTLVSFVLWAAAYVPANHIKARLHHPLLLGVKVWALAHLVATGLLVHLVLFGSFLVWAVLDFRALRRLDRRENTHYAPGSLRATVVAVLLGVAAWAVFAFGLHGLLIGIKPYG